MRNHARASHHFIETCFVTESTLMEQVRQEALARAPGMQVSPHEGKMLALFAMMIQARQVLEIGTFLGYSALWIASVLPDDGCVTTLEARSDHAALARAHFDRTPYPERFVVMEGAALGSLDRLRQQQPVPCYDMVFIDAAKAEYPEYLERVLPMVKPGGVIAADNTLLFGHMYGEPWQRASQAAIDAMQRFNVAIADDKRFYSVLIPTEEGLSVAIKHA